MYVRFDSETRCPVSVRDTGPWLYASHPWADFYCWAVKIDSRETRVYLNEELIPPEVCELFPNRMNQGHLAWIMETADEIEAHNIGFDAVIWQKVMVEKHGFKPVPVEKWRDSAAQCAYHGLPRDLKRAAIVLGLSEQKDDKGAYYISKLHSPYKLTKNDPRRKGLKGDGFVEREKDNGWFHPLTGEIRYFWRNDHDLLEGLIRYCAQDVETQYGISAFLPALPPFEAAIRQLDQVINSRGIPLDVPSIQSIIRLIETQGNSVEPELKALTGGKVQTVGQVEQIANFCGLPSLSKDVVSEALKNPYLSKEIRRVLEIRQELGLSSVKKYRAMLHRMCPDGYARDTQMYYGAGTGRFSGKGIQPHNFVRECAPEGLWDTLLSAFRDGNFSLLDMLYGNVSHAAKVLLRLMFKAPEGYEILCADFAGIEARVVMWLAGQEDGLEMFRQKFDIYCEMASEIYGYPCTKKGHPTERQVGKQAILGCGFGMGGPKFRVTCRTQAKVELDKAQSRKSVRTYRKRFDKVPALWRDLEDAAIQAVENPGKTFHAGHVPIGFHYDGRILKARLPSRRDISYMSPEIHSRPAYFFPAVDPEGEPASILVVSSAKLATIEKMAEKKAEEDGVRLTGGYKESLKKILCFWAVDSHNKWTLEATYGGKLTENIVQGIARDLMCAAMLRIEGLGVRIFLTIHDEILGLVKKGLVALETFISCMASPPDWAKGCPIDVEGWISERFHKE